MSGESTKKPFRKYIYWALAFVLTTIAQQYIQKVGDLLPLWLLLLIYFAIAIVLVFLDRDGLWKVMREILDVFALWIRKSDVVENEDFPYILKHYIKKLPKEEGIISFYNVPLATLEDEAARKELWVNTIGLNKRVKEFRLLLPKDKFDDLVEGLSQISNDFPDNGLGYLEKLVSKIRLVIVSFPPEMLLNFACMMEDDFQKRPVFSSTTVMAPPFWNGKKFSHFFAFRGANKHSEAVCCLIRDHIKHLWDKSQGQLPYKEKLEYPAIVSAVEPRQMFITLERVIKHQDLRNTIIDYSRDKRD